MCTGIRDCCYAFACKSSQANLGLAEVGENVGRVLGHGKLVAGVGPVDVVLVEDKGYWGAVGGFFGGFFGGCGIADCRRGSGCGVGGGCGAVVCKRVRITCDACIEDSNLSHQAKPTKRHLVLAPQRIFFVGVLVFDDLGLVPTIKN